MDTRKHDKKQEIAFSREAVERAEDARINALRKEAAERQRQTGKARVHAEQEKVEAQNQAAQAQMQAEQANLQAQQAAAAKAQADAERARRSRYRAGSRSGAAGHAIGSGPARELLAQLNARRRAG